MAAALIYCPKPRRIQEFGHTGAPSPFSSLAVKQPRTNRLAAWMLDEDAPFCEQPPTKRIQAVLCSVYMVEVHFAEETKPIDNIPAVIAGLAFRYGYAVIPRITSASYGQSRGGHGSYPGRRGSGGVSQSAPGSTVPPGAGNGGGGPSKRPMKRSGGGDGEGNPSKKKKLSNDPQGQLRCIIFFELSQQSPEGNEGHPCRDKWFTTLESVVDHHLRMHVKHIQCDACLIRKGTRTDMGKHERANPNCTRPRRIREEILTHAENIRNVKSWDELKRQVAPNGEILYDVASNTDNLPQPPPDEDNNQVGQPATPPQHDDNNRVGQPPAPPQHDDNHAGQPVAPPQHDDNHAEQPVALHHMGSLDAVDTSRLFQEMEALQNRYPPYNHSGISFNTELLTSNDTINPQRLVKPSFDSGYPGPEGSSYQYDEEWNKASTGEVGQVTSANTKFYHHQCQTTTGGAGWLTSGNRTPEQNSISKLLERVDGVIQVSLECDNHLTERGAAHFFTQALAALAPERVLRAFADAYQIKVGLREEAQAGNPLYGAKGKEKEQHRDVPGGA